MFVQKNKKHTITDRDEIPIIDDDGENDLVDDVEVEENRRLKKQKPMSDLALVDRLTDKQLNQVFK